MITALLLLVMATACNNTLSPSNKARKQKGITVKKSNMWVGETTATVDGIVVKVNAAGQKDPYPDRLPEIVATDKGPDQDAVMQWFAPLQTIEDTAAKPSIFYPVGSRWFLIDKEGNKKGKLSIDKFGGIYYMRIGPAEKSPMFFRYGDAEPMAKDFIKNHGGVPDENLTLASQRFREVAPNSPDKIVCLEREYGHEFKGIDIWDDRIEVSVTKLSGAHYYRCWHEFKAEGSDKILLGPAQSQVIAEQIIRAYKKDWQMQPDKFTDILSGQKPLSIELQQLVYFDPRPRDIRHFYDTQAIYHPGWIVRVSKTEKSPMYTYVDESDTADRTGGAKPEPIVLVNTPADIGIPPLIIDAINGHVYERKPKGDNLFK
ncbi:MAG: hypothetical protein GW874_06945 [Solirubrobacter sp.]|nr:hypothetical protein [Solirubrobacter sp.]